MGVVVGAEISTLEVYADLNVTCGFAKQIQSASFIIKKTKCEIDKKSRFLELLRQTYMQAAKLVIPVHNFVKQLNRITRITMIINLVSSPDAHALNKQKGRLVFNVNFLGTES